MSLLFSIFSSQFSIKNFSFLSRSIAKASCKRLISSVNLSAMSRNLKNSDIWAPLSGLMGDELSWRVSPKPRLKLSDEDEHPLTGSPQFLESSSVSFSLFRCFVSSVNNALFTPKIIYRIIMLYSQLIYLKSIMPYN